MPEEKDDAQGAGEHASGWLQALLEAMPQGMMVSDLAGKIVAMNRTALELHRFTSMDEVGTGPSRRADAYEVSNLGGEVISFEESPLGRVLRGDTFSDAEVRLIRKDTGQARIYSYSSAPVLDRTGRPVLALTSVRDLTAQRATEQALRESEERWRALMDHVPAPIQGYRGDGTVTYWNRASERLYGYSAAEAIGRNLGDLIIPPEVQADFRKALTIGAELSASREFLPPAELELLCKDGTRVPVHSTHTAVCSPDSPPTLFCLDLDLSERKRMEQALRESEQRLQAMVQNLSDIIVIVEPDGTRRYTSAAVERSLGYAPAELVGRSIFEFIHSEDRERVRADFERCVRTADAVSRTEMCVQARDGSWRYYECVCQNLLDKPPIHGMLLTSRDITERRRTEEAFIASEERFRIAEKIARMGHFEWDTVNDSIVASPSLEMIHGLRPGSFRGGFKRWLELVHPDDRERVRVIPPVAFAQEREEESFELRIVRPDGEPRWLKVQARASYGPNGTPVRVLGAMTDITERKRTEQALRESEERLRLATDAAGLSTWDVDMRTGDVVWSDRHFRLFGYEPTAGGKATLEMWRSRVHPEDLEAVIAAIERAECQAGYYSLEHRVVRADGGETIWVRVLGRFLYDEKAHPARFVGVIFDITERKLAEDKLSLERDRLEVHVQERTAELAKAHRKLRQLSAHLLETLENERRLLSKEIHDSVGQVLAAVKYRVEEGLLQVGKGKVRAKLEPLEAIIPTIQRSIEEVRRIQTSLRPLILDELGLLSTIQWFCREFEKTFPRLRVESDVQLKESQLPPPLKNVVFRILQEAMNNAGKHGAAGLVRLRLRKTRSSIELVIQDDGQGFDLKKAQNVGVFERGLGLSSMRERAELSGGSCRIRSAEGKGTTVRACWPVR
ncbi:MAG: PAS domain S-box protein [bacterium]